MTQFQQEFFALDAHGFQGHLGDESHLVLDIHFQVLPIKDGFSLRQDTQQFPGAEAMMGVLVDPGLKATEGIGSQDTATIDEVFLHPCHFGDMGVRGNHRSIRKLKSEVPLWILGQQDFEFRQMHGVTGFWGGRIDGLVWPEALPAPEQ